MQSKRDKPLLPLHIFRYRSLAVNIPMLRNVVWRARGPEKVLPRMRHQKVVSVAPGVQYLISNLVRSQEFQLQHTHNIVWIFMESHESCRISQARRRYKISRVLSSFFYSGGGVGGGGIVYSGAVTRTRCLFIFPLLRILFFPERPYNERRPCVSIYTRQATEHWACRYAMEGVCLQRFFAQRQSGTRGKCEMARLFLLFIYGWENISPHTVLRKWIEKWNKMSEQLFGIVRYTRYVRRCSRQWYTHTTTYKWRCRRSGINFNGMPAGESLHEFDLIVCDVCRFCNAYVYLLSYCRLKHIPFLLLCNTLFSFVSRHTPSHIATHSSIYSIAMRSNCAVRTQYWFSFGWENHRFLFRQLWFDLGYLCTRQALSIVAQFSLCWLNDCL